MLIVYGSRKTHICQEEFMIYCPCCESDSFANVLITSVYFHVFFIPFFPYDKEINSICDNCGLKRYEIPFDKNSIKNEVELKGKFKHPLHTYTFSILLFILIILIFIIAPK
jgi:C4-type Zn-finger protein